MSITGQLKFAPIFLCVFLFISFQRHFFSYSLNQRKSNENVFSVSQKLLLYSKFLFLLQKIMFFILLVLCDVAPAKAKHDRVIPMWRFAWLVPQRVWTHRNIFILIFTSWMFHKMVVLATCMMLVWYGARWDETPPLGGRSVAGFWILWVDPAWIRLDRAVFTISV